MYRQPRGNMLYEKLKGQFDDYHILKLAHVMLDCDEGLSEEQYDVLREFVYDQIGPTIEMRELFDLVEATDGRFYIPDACKTNHIVV